MTDSEIKGLHDQVFRALEAGGWVHSATYTDGHGYHVMWTARGAAASHTLKMWYAMLHLGDADLRPYLAIVLARGTAIDPASDPAIAAALQPYVHAGFAVQAAFSAQDGVKVRWSPAGLAFRSALRDLVDHLPIAITEDSALVLFGIADAWAPGEDTPVITDN